MGAIPQGELLNMYLSGKSMWEIGQIIGCSVHKVTYWMKQYGIPKRSRSDAMYQKLNPLGDPFKIKTNLSSEENFLYGLGLGIYWGEGNKSDKYSVRVTNSDPHIILTFIKFLKEICQINVQKLSYSIVCFQNSSPLKAVNYWSDQLNTPTTKFGKIVQIPPQGKGTYKKKSEYGVCSVTFSNIKLKKWIMERLYRPDSSTAERIHGKD